MQSWSSEMWQTAAIGFVLGIIIGYLIVRFTKGSVKKQVKTETELKELKNQVATQQQELEKHFSQSAELLKDLAQDYQKLYQHLAQASTALLPESTAKVQFNQTLIEPQQVQTDVEVIKPETAVQQIENNKENQPKDYSEGSSGILKAEK